MAQAAAFGDLVGAEATDVGVHVIEGPGMDMARVPQGGRNFEYLGEDPMLAGAMAVPYIRAMQAHGIIGMAKHFVGNDQEANRNTVNDIIDDRWGERGRHTNRQLLGRSSNRLSLVPSARDRAALPIRVRSFVHDFRDSKLEVTPKVSDGKHAILVQFFVQNTGSTPGAEVPQVYMGLPPATGEPPKRLVAFNKVKLNPGEKTKVQVLIDPAATNHPLATWDTESQNWTVAQGDYQAYVGNSSADVAAADSFTVRTPAGQGH